MHACLTDSFINRTVSINMLDYPITVVLNVFDTLENKGLKVYKFMSIQTQEAHISHIKNDVSAILFFSPVQVGEDITHQEQFIHNGSLSIPLTH